MVLGIGEGDNQTQEAIYFKKNEYRKLPAYYWSSKEAMPSVLFSLQKREHSRSEEELEAIREIKSFK